ncbi:MAG: TIGR04282 family arsenosugar biosynthesis glycosyltransferase, partial [Verrucomicrobiota bacterium]
MNRLILIFLKYPEPGQVKTRLAASVGPDAAALIYQRLVSDLFLQLAESDSSTSIRFAVEPADRQGELENWIKELWGDSPHFIDFVPQAGGTLGERLRESVKDAFLEGHAPVLILGSDCPEVTPQILEDAWKALETSDVVFGPALDGGYYLAAFRQFEPQLFEVPWSAENTLEVSLRKADELGLKTHQLLPLTDVDELKDWQGYQDRLLHQRPNAAPLRFHPLYKERVWGGRTLETRYGRDLPSDAPYGESWELVDRAGEQSQIIQGDLAGFTLHDLWERDRDLWFGPGLEGERFPLLVKILDARDDLSLQVHPPDSVAASLDGEPKTEMWYVAHAEPGARIYVGVNEGVTPESFRASLEDGTAASQVHVIEPQAGDFLFIPSGRLHAIGAGLLIYEIQENSDTTYRVFDWNRLGLDGNPRQLHLEEAMRCIDFEDIEPSATQRARDTLVKCRQFHVRQWS